MSREDDDVELAGAVLAALGRLPRDGSRPSESSVTLAVRDGLGGSGPNGAARRLSRALESVGAGEGLTAALDAVEERPSRVRGYVEVADLDTLRAVSADVAAGVPLERAARRRRDPGAGEAG